MIIVRLTGGLGNQMFQYAAAYSLSRIKGLKLKLDITSFSEQNKNETVRSIDILNFNLKEDRVASLKEIKKVKYPYGNISKLTGYLAKKIFFQYNIDWNPGFFKKSTCSYLDGYYQSENYFDEFFDDIKSQFSLPLNNDKSFREIEDLILSCPNSVSIHIRRGDYISNPKAKKYHHICTENYYYMALRLIEKKIGEVKVFVFSDDIDWVKQNLDFPKNSVYVSNLLNGQENMLRNNQELLLMSKCKNNIISNSTFSWWAAYLNNNINKLIVTPSIWNLSRRVKHKYLLPESWLRIDV